MSVINANSLDANQVLEVDLCIVGGGPIGLSIAHDLIGSGISVILVETGGEKREEAAETLSGGETVGDKYAPLTMYRRRMLGGASAIWGGRCVPYDPIDFEVRDYVPNSGWPIPFSELSNYYAPANTLADAGDPEFDAEVAIPNAPPLIEGFKRDIVLTNNLERFSLPTNFWKKLGPELRAATNVRILSHATCTNLSVNEKANSISQANFTTLDFRKFTIRAKKFVVAAGGIETYRLLASSNDVLVNGIGNAHDVLGRYFMSHIEGHFATLRLDNPRRSIQWGFDMARGNIYTRRRLSIAPEAQRKNRLLNTIVRLHHANAVNPEHRDGVLSTMFLAKNFILPEYRSKITMVERNAAAEMPLGMAFWINHLQNVAQDAPRLAMFLVEWIRRRNLATRRIPYVVMRNAKGEYPLDFNSEQIPNWESRLTLTDKRDRFDIPFVNVDWRIMEADVLSIANTFRLMKSEFEAAGVGTIDFGVGLLEDTVYSKSLPIGGHHIGIARMHEDPRFGVVDANLLVHGIENLFVASTAVLPTSSHANPTLTTLALALRLAKHIRGETKPLLIKTSKTIAESI